MAVTEAAHPVFGGGRLLISERCVNRQHRGAACANCADACPVASISLASGVPVLDTATCVGCGACIPRCPTEAIGTTSSSRALARAVVDAPPGPVMLTCPRGRTSPAGIPVVRLERCLSALGADELLDLAGHPPRDLWLDDTPCQSCELAELHAAIVGTVGRAGDLREVFGLRPVIHRTTDEELELAPVGAGVPVVIAGRGGAISRRALFRQISAVVSRSAGAEEDGVRPPRRERLLRHLVAERAGRAPGNAPVADVDVGFGDVHVDTDRCSACGLCAQFCPTGALQFESSSSVGNGGTFTLSFRPADCVACMVCVVACPEQAIAVGSAVHPELILSGTTETVASGAAIRCDVCSQLTTSAPDGRNRCFSCRDGVVTPMRDEAGLMADLIARTALDPRRRHPHEPPRRRHERRDEGGRWSAQTQDLGVVEDA